MGLNICGSMDSTKPIYLTDTMRINIATIQFSGTWLPTTGTSRTIMLLYKIWRIFILGLFTSLFLSEVTGMIKALGNLEEMIQNSFLLLTHTPHAYKNYRFIRYIKQIQHLTNQLNSKQFQPRNDNDLQILKPTLLRKHFETIMALSFCTLTVLLWSIFPFLDHDQGSKVLPLKGWFPFSTNISPIYELTFVYQIIAAMYMAWDNAAKDTFITGLIANICGQIDLLRESVLHLQERTLLELNEPSQYIRTKEGKDVSEESLWEKNQNKSDSLYKKILDKRGFTSISELIVNIRNQSNSIREGNPIFERQIAQNFKRCVQRHVAILNFVLELEHLFSWHMFFQLSASVAILCITGFQLTLVVPLSVEFFSMILYQICMIMQIGIYCWHGNELIKKSESLSDAIYQTNWTNCNKILKHDIKYFMLFSQRPLQIKAGKYFILSMDLFTYILRSSYSYFAFLQRVKEQNNA